MAILEKKKSDLTGEDYAHMRKVNGYRARHLKQKPDADDFADTTWADSLQNWGRDPT